MKPPQTVYRRQDDATLKKTLSPEQYAVTRKNICFLGIPIMKVLKSSRCEKCYLFHLKVKENKRRIAA